MGRTRTLSGIRATGRLHLGNYLGAICQWTREQRTDHDSFYFIADLHGLTDVGRKHSGERFANERQRTAATFIAAGLDPARATLFFQSSVPQHTEMMWYIATIARKGELERMTQWKDKAGTNQAGASASLYIYPVLMAADILLYDANEVPVGDDQRQHVEIARDWAGRFNSYLGSTLVVPKAVLPLAAARIMDLQAPHRKMSKSGASELGTVFIDDTSDGIRDKIRRAVTDSSRGMQWSAESAGITNLVNVYAAITERDRLNVLDEFSRQTYRTFKDAVAEAIIDAFDPIRTRLQSLMASPQEIKHHLDKGAKRAVQVASGTCQRVRDALGLND